MREIPTAPRCLSCGSHFQIERAHWPKAVGIGRNRKRADLPTVPLCRTCHTKMHAGDRGVTERVVAEAPGYWQDMGEWDFAEPLFRRWLSRREYLEAVR
jgi:hypothetical protein